MARLLVGYILRAPPIITWLNIFPPVARDRPGRIHSMSCLFARRPRWEERARIASGANARVPHGWITDCETVTQITQRVSCQNGNRHSVSAAVIACCRIATDGAVESCLEILEEHAFLMAKVPKKMSIRTANLVIPAEVLTLCIETEGKKVSIFTQ